MDDIAGQAYAITKDEFRKLGKDEQGAIEGILRQEWKTPVPLWSSLNNEFRFDIDVAASEHNTLCAAFIDRDQDALKGGWFDRGARAAFCNPGFSDGESWAHCAHMETSNHSGVVAVVIGIASIGSEWFRFAAQHASEIRLLNPRVQFVSPRPDIIKKSSNPNETAAYIFRGRRPSGPAHITVQHWQ